MNRWLLSVLYFEENHNFHGHPYLQLEVSRSGILLIMENWFWILGWSLCILTIAGNGFIIFLVCSKRQLRTKTEPFVVSLAVADFCVGMSVVPPMFICEIATGCTRQLSWIIFLRLLFSYASVMNLCSLVVDRYIAVNKPFKYFTFMTRRLVVQMVSVSWGIPIDQFRYI